MSHRGSTILAILGFGIVIIGALIASSYLPVIQAQSVTPNNNCLTSSISIVNLASSPNPVGEGGLVTVSGSIYAVENCIPISDYQGYTVSWSASNGGGSGSAIPLSNGAFTFTLNAPNIVGTMSITASPAGCIPSSVLTCQGESIAQKIVQQQVTTYSVTFAVNPSTVSGNIAVEGGPNNLIVQQPISSPTFTNLPAGNYSYTVYPATSSNTCYTSVSGTFSLPAQSGPVSVSLTSSNCSYTNQVVFDIVPAVTGTVTLGLQTVNIQNGVANFSNISPGTYDYSVKPSVSCYGTQSGQVVVAGSLTTVPIQLNGANCKSGAGGNIGGIVFLENLIVGVIVIIVGFFVMAFGARRR